MASGLTLARRVRQHGVEGGLQLARRTGNDTQHFRSRRLLLQRFAQLVEQARILDGDDGLSRKILEQRDLFVAEWANFLAIDYDGAD
jgi:hypothetical protein